MIFDRHQEFRQNPVCAGGLVTDALNFHLRKTPNSLVQLHRDQNWQFFTKDTFNEEF